jgi:hypothetical protein
MKGAWIFGLMGEMVIFFWKIIKACQSYGRLQIPGGVMIQWGLFFDSRIGKKFSVFSVQQEGNAEVPSSRQDTNFKFHRTRLKLVAIGETGKS